MRKINLFFAGVMVAFALSMTSCAIVRPGEVGIVQKFGVIKGEPIKQGSKWFNPTKEGLSVNTEISLLYHVNPAYAKDVYTRFGRNYEEVMVLSNFRATAREVSARYFAKELYATERIKIEKAVADELSSHIAQYGFVVDAVLLKDIDLPAQLVQAIENKVNAEQAVLQMEFVVERQKKEAERLVIEAEGIKKAQTIINESLTEKLLQYNNIQMLKSLVNSPNSKVIVTDGGSSQLMVNTEKN